MSVCRSCGETTTGRIMRHQCPPPVQGAEKLFAAPAPERERRVLAKGWLPTDGGEPVWKGWDAPRLEVYDQPSAHAVCVEIVEIVEATPPEKEER